MSLKLPTFLAARPDVWFQLTEAQFNLRNITDSTTQYFYLLTSLDAAVAERMVGDVSLTQAVGKYEYLKSKLMGVYGLTDDQKADRLLDLTGLGDWTPSQLCAYIQTGIVFFDVFSCGNYQKMFECSSPHLGKADIIMAEKHAQPVINASNHPPRKHSPARRSPKDTICWYHAKFGNKAKACRPPCLFSSSAKHCLSFRKRSGQHLVAQVADQNPSRLLYMWYRKAGNKFLVDTGAQVSVFPASSHDRRREKTEPLVAANGTRIDTRIDTFGKRCISIDLGFRKFNWYFVLADVHHPMLGADFFCSNHLLIDVHTRHIVDAETYESVPQASHSIKFRA